MSKNERAFRAHVAAGLPVPVDLYAALEGEGIFPMIEENDDDEQ